MPGFYPIDEYDLAGYCTGVVDKDRIIDNKTMTPGDVIIALPSSGVHSNGFSLVRKVFDVENRNLTLPVDELGGKSIGETLLTPTKIYVKPVLALLEKIKIKGISHITGGGFYEGALLTTVLVLVAESFLSRLEYRILDHVPEINLYMEYTGKPCLEEVLRFLRENKVSLQDMEITRNSDSESHNACAIFSLRFSKGVSVDELLTHVSQIEGVITVQEL